MPRAIRRVNASQPQTQSQSRSQPRNGNPSQLPRRKRLNAAAEEDEEDEDEEQREEEEQDTEMEDRENDSGDNTVEHKANDLVRLALFTEYRRATLKRDEITKRLFGGRASKKVFEPVFERAQHILRKTFGMEFYEIMSRAERDKVDAAREGARPADGEVAAVAGLKKRATTSSKQYILRSVLDSTIIAAASFNDFEIEEADREELALWHPDNDSEIRPDGTLMAWKYSSADQLGMSGILHVLLGLILVNGRVLTDMQLRTYLKRLRIPMGSPVPSSTMTSAVKSFTIDAYLAQLVKQSYLDKQKTSLASTQGGGAQKRPRNGGGNDDGDTSFEWKWGTRAIAEIGEEGIGSFVVDFMESIERERENRRTGEDGPRGNSKKDRENMEKRKEKLTTAVGRAAGGGLVPFE